ncbi:MAG: DNA repair protein RecO [Christensenellaceae bacterium]|jgi:DNA repair protein RecO|nr:DNA repair protein RecO [Christensenellaceae bacterium]
MEIKLTALCIKAIEYGEKDKLITLLNPTHGKLLVHARSVRDIKAKLKLAAQPLCFGDYILQKVGHDKLLMTGCTITEHYFNCWSDIARNLAAQVILEAIDQLAFDKSECSSDVLNAYNALSSINYSSFSPYLSVGWFLTKSLQDLGINSEELDLPHSFISIKKMFDVLHSTSLDWITITASELRKYFHYLDIIYKSSVIGKLGTLELAMNNLLI